MATKHMPERVRARLPGLVETTSFSQSRVDDRHPSQMDPSIRYGKAPLLSTPGLIVHVTPGLILNGKSIVSFKESTSPNNLTLSD